MQKRRLQTERQSSYLWQGVRPDCLEHLDTICLAVAAIAFDTHFTSESFDQTHVKCSVIVCTSYIMHGQGTIHCLTELRRGQHR
jgi:hypothetical protein